MTASDDSAPSHAVCHPSVQAAGKVYFMHLETRLCPLHHTQLIEASLCQNQSCRKPIPPSSTPPPPPPCFYLHGKIFAFRRILSESFPLSGPQRRCTRRLSSLLPSFNTMHLDCASSFSSSAGYLNGKLCSSHSYCASTSISMRLCQWVSWIGGISLTPHGTAVNLH